MFCRFIVGLGMVGGLRCNMEYLHLCFNFVFSLSSFLAFLDTAM